MTEEEFKNRTKKLAVDTVRACESMPRTITASVIHRQLTKSATSVSANYRSACRARSTDEMLAKLGIVEEEADETMHWLEIAAEIDLIPKELSATLHADAEEILRMVIASINTLKRRRRRKADD